MKNTVNVEKIIFQTNLLQRERDDGADKTFSFTMCFIRIQRNFLLKQNAAQQKYCQFVHYHDKNLSEETVTIIS